MSTNILLSVQDLSKRFGGLIALDNVTLEISSKEVVGIIGPNGAGKTTLINTISGFLRADSGRKLFKNIDVTDFHPHKLAREGLVRCFQLPRPFKSMTLFQNCLISAFQAKQKHADLDPEKAAQEVLQRLDLSKKKDMYASHLGNIDLKLLEFCRAILMKPDLLLLDEPFVGASLQGAKEIRKMIDDYIINDGGAVAIVEHNIPVVRSISGRLIVMNFGKIIADGEPSEVLAKNEVIRAYFGGS